MDPSLVVTEMSDLASNPFAALFSSVEEAEEYRKECLAKGQEYRRSNTSSHSSSLTISSKSENIEPRTTQGDVDERDSKELARLVNDFLQRVFLVTVCRDGTKTGLKHTEGLPRRCVYLQDIDEEDGTLLCWTNIDMVLMERLTMSNPRSNVIITGGGHLSSLSAEIEAGEAAILKYLAACYRRAQEENKKWKLGKNEEVVKHAEKAKTLVIAYAGTCLVNPAMFAGQDTHKQLFNLFISAQGDNILPDFLDKLVLQTAGSEELSTIFSPILSMLHDSCKGLTLLQYEVHHYLEIVLFFVKHKDLAEILVESHSWFPPKAVSATGRRLPISGRAFEHQSLLGPFVQLSSMSGDPANQSVHFMRPADQTKSEMQAAMGNLRTQLDVLNDKLYGVFFSMMRASPSTRHNVLYWVGACLHSNASRKQMMSELFASSQASDGFFLNLGMILMKVCQPFLDPASPKLLKINPKYCAVTTNIDAIKRQDTGLHAVGLEKETRVVTPPDEDSIKIRVTPAFGFVTECFFMTHRCLHLGLWKVCDKYMKLMSELNHMQRVYQDVASQGVQGPMLEMVQKRFENGMIEQLAMKTHLLNPSMMTLAVRFYVATAAWLNQLAMAGDDFEDVTEFKEVEMPLPSETPAGLLFVPEFVVESVADFIIFLRHFSEESLESAGRSLRHFMTFFVIYMGSPERVKNPHLRAKLAEALEALTPTERNQEQQGVLGILSRQLIYRQDAFLQHKLAIDHLPGSLLKLFVDIEFTGHSMQFEQKFGYRHHMYTVLEYMWGQEQYKATLLRYSEEASQNSTAADAPLFLRFINLLINDAIFLLDEVLQFMAEIRNLQKEKEHDDWEKLSDDAKQEKQQLLQRTTSMARNHNILANETVRALNYITADVKGPFVSSCMVDRMTSMLNYFLLNLTGPKMGSFKVTGFSEFNFKPQQLLSDIIDIYLNLGGDEAFCEAVGRDGRCYSETLFEQAGNVLRKIGRPATIVFRLSELSKHIKDITQQAIEQELPEPPEEFLDPIMQTLMKDPVLLPSSGHTVDRGTISRHLLSDQKDPFNRSPLTMDMVEPNLKLKGRIEQWLKECRDNKG